jgi:hypothetical protein
MQEDGVRTERRSSLAGGTVRSNDSMMQAVTTGVGAGSL